MRARTIREGSVGLLILIGVGLFGALVLWLRGLSPGNRTYRLNVEFENTPGMLIGTVVRYRGVPVGRILTIDTGANVVDVTVEISKGDLRIPSGSIVQANQTGLIGEVFLDILPRKELSDIDLALSPLGRDCDASIIVCDGDRLRGISGASYESLVLSVEELVNLFSDPVLIDNIKTIVDNTTDLTASAGQLTTELTALTQSVQEELGPLTTSAKNATDSVGKAAQQLQLTAAQMNDLLTDNRAGLVSILDNISASSDRLVAIMDTLEPVVTEGEFVQNLTTLSTNAAAASTDLREMVNAFNTSTNVLMLQQTLESARDVFQSAQKIMADVDELTGDPAFRNNVRDLINSLSGLVSSTEDLEQQTQLAQILAPTASETPVTVSLTPPSPENNHPPLVLIHEGQQYSFRSLAQPTLEAGEAAAP
ncbi:MAG: MlaD family protein [Leptolyngbyaceae cyanobacterium MO_188.B28]|nr:MlaD family protein [Leptolyngbyaceae cyanobacterium MO_188.B28]